MRFMSNEKKEELNQFMDDQTNWRSACQKCGHVFVGTKTAIGLAMEKHMREKHGE